MHQPTQAQPGRVLLPFRIGAAQMRAFREISGDDNPLHDDAAFARLRGFDGPVVYGGLLVARISHLLGTVLPGPGCVWHSLKLNFRRPLMVDESACLTGETMQHNGDLGLYTLSLRITAGSDLVADGTALAALARPQPQEAA